MRAANLSGQPAAENMDEYNKRRRNEIRKTDQRHISKSLGNKEKTYRHD